MIEFRMPSLGADMEAGTLIEWKKKQGDKVKHGDIIAEVETQKGLIEIEVFDEGTITELLVKEGTKVPVGTLLALINPMGVSLKEKMPEKTEGDLQPTEEKIIKKTAERIKIKVSPLAKKIASENNIDISMLVGTGPDGAITKDDVDKAIAERGKTETPFVEKAQEKTEKVKTHSPVQAIRSAVAAAMGKSNREIPHYYLEKKLDMAKSLVWLQEKNRQRPIKKRLLPIALLLKAVAKTLIDFPDLNAVWENGLQQKKEINIGFVVSLRAGGILVPAIHNVDMKSIDEIMESLNDIIPRARALTLRSSELSDSTITVTSIGEGEADAVFGIIYPPHVALIGFGNVSEQPFAENGMLGIRPILTVTLAGDHRATDGLTGSRFLGVLNKYLQNPETL